jgi:7,8-dihydropterin-6-yl-methyl-4-(beta-D-ribofuranosyl)aminobenzene 5'-phosphate synthase
LLRGGEIDKINKSKFDPERLRKGDTDGVISIVYDNNSVGRGIKPSWGFAALIEHEGRQVLFDTGGDAGTLLGNASAMGVDLHSVPAVFLSHAHGDHTGGFSALLRPGLKVFIPRSFPAGFFSHVQKAGAIPVVVSDPLWCMEGFRSTGELGRGVLEQSLIVEAPAGLVLITGCAHPGIVNIADFATRLAGRPLSLVLGGFHLGGTTDREVIAIVKALKGLGVERVAPCHCTGRPATRILLQSFGDKGIAVAAGSVVSF